jgi:PAS domain S-box-containing protein
MTARSQESETAERLRESESKAKMLSLVAELTDNAVILTDPHGLIVWTNQGFTRITGYSAQEVLGKRPGAVLQGRQTDPETVRRIAAHLARLEPFREQILNYRKGGAPYWIDLEIRPVYDDAGNLTNFMALQRDITAERSLNQRLWLRHQVTSLLVECDDLQTALTQSAEEIARILGWSQAVVYRVNETVLERLTGSAESSTPIARGQGPAGQAWACGAIKWSEQAQAGEPQLLCVPLTCSGQVWGVMQFRMPEDLREPDQDLLDVLEFLGYECGLYIERAIAREQLVAARDAAEDASAVKSQFVATVSHEIRTPLNAVVGMADLLSEMPLGDRQREYLKVIQDSADQLLTVINDVLDLSSIESGTVRLGETDFSVRQQAERIAQIVRALPGAARLQILVQIEPEVPEWLRGDEARLSQALINLMSNAVKFTEQGSVTLQISAEPKADEPTSVWVSFSVRDTGIGISPSVQDRIFEPYFQTGSSLITPQKGTGLGLAISRQIARLMGGEMTLQSEVGQGANFTFIAPIRIGRTEVPTAAPESGQTPTRSLDILVAEDTPASQLVIQLMLENLGHRVTIANDGLEAVKAFREKRFDLVLMDVQMPEMDGYEAAKTIRALGPDECPEGVRDGRQVPIVGLSAFAMASNRLVGIASGMNAYLTKPVKREALFRLIAGIAQNKPSDG